MRELRMQVSLYLHAGGEWPFAETDTHWIALGTDQDLTEAFKIALRNVLAFLERKAALTRLAAQGTVLAGAFSPGREGREHCHPDVLRQLRRRSLAALE